MCVCVCVCEWLSYWQSHVLPFSRSDWLVCGNLRACSAVRRLESVTWNSKEKIQLCCDCGFHRHKSVWKRSDTNYSCHWEQGKHTKVRYFSFYSIKLFLWVIAQNQELCTILLSCQEHCLFPFKLIRSPNSNFTITQASLVNLKQEQKAWRKIQIGDVWRMTIRHGVAAFAFKINCCMYTCLLSYKCLSIPGNLLKCCACHTNCTVTVNLWINFLHHDV